jgi:hypothetical protein
MTMSRFALACSLSVALAMGACGDSGGSDSEGGGGGEGAATVEGGGGGGGEGTGGGTEGTEGSEGTEGTAPSCTEGEHLCDGATLQTCAAGALTTVEECGEGTVCDAAAGACACVPTCEAKACGDDGCGGSCGECGPGTACSEVGQCAQVCIGKGTGKDVGDSIQNILWQESTGDEYFLHQGCGAAQVTVLIETAEW